MTMPQNDHVPKMSMSQNDHTPSWKSPECTAGGEENLKAMISLEVLEDQVQMGMVDSLQSVDDCLNAAFDKNKVAILEELVTLWCSQVEKVRGQLIDR